MDNAKMGELIRDSRKEKGLTQKDVADKLGITDRAVSKWERGICAPDIAYIEELAEMLGLTVAELIAGQRMEHPPAQEVESAIKETITYSQNEMQSKRKAASKRTWIAVGILLLLVIAITIGVLWYQGAFYKIGTYPSPDGKTITTVYSRMLSHGKAPSKDGFTLSDEGYYRGRHGYGEAEFRGLWWSPNSCYQVVSMDTEDGIWLALTDYTRNIGTNLTNRLERTLYECEFFEDVPYDEEGWKPLITFEFLQWSEADPEVMQVYFCYTDKNGLFQEGYMWYDYETAEASGHMRLKQGEKESDPFYDLINDLMS